MTELFDYSIPDTIKYNDNFTKNQYKLFSIIDAKHDFGDPKRAPGIKQKGLLNDCLVKTRGIDVESKITTTSNIFDSTSSDSTSSDKKTYFIKSAADTLHPIIARIEDNNQYKYQIKGP